MSLMCCFRTICSNSMSKQRNGSCDSRRKKRKYFQAQNRIKILQFEENRRKTSTFCQFG